MGLLRITSTELGELRFEPPADRCQLDLAALREKVASAPVVVMVPAQPGAPCLPRASTSAPPCGGAVDVPGAGVDAAVDPPGPAGAGSDATRRLVGGVPAAGDRLEPTRPGASAAGQDSREGYKGPALEPLVRALRDLGHRADAARERVQEAAEHFQSLGQTPTVEQILKRALLSRPLRAKMVAREAAKAAAKPAAAAPVAPATTAAAAT